MITKEQLESRRSQLLKEQKELQESHEQMGKNINAYAGAIQDCEFWISELEKEESQSKKKEIK